MEFSEIEKDLLVLGKYKNTKELTADNKYSIFYIIVHKGKILKFNHKLNNGSLKGKIDSYSEGILEYIKKEFEYDFFSKLSDVDKDIIQFHIYILPNESKKEINKIYKLQNKFDNENVHIINNITFKNLSNHIENKKTLYFNFLLFSIYAYVWYVYKGLEDIGIKVSLINDIVFFVSFDLLPPLILPVLFLFLLIIIVIIFISLIFLIFNNEQTIKQHLIKTLEVNNSTIFIMFYIVMIILIGSLLYFPFNYYMSSVWKINYFDKSKPTLLIQAYKESKGFPRIIEASGNKYIAIKDDGKFYLSYNLNKVKGSLFIDKNAIDKFCKTEVEDNVTRAINMLQLATYNRLYNTENIKKDMQLKSHEFSIENMDINNELDKYCKKKQLKKENIIEK